MDPSRIFLAVEDFIYMPNVTYGGDDSRISLQIIWGLEGYRMGRADQFKIYNPDATFHLPTMVMQTASEAKAYATNVRLKDFGMWVVGRDHERSAFQHVAYFLKRYKMSHHNGRPSR